ncbi:MAG: sodium-dependent transporter [Gammaproteobacteria bacterium]|nr:sodium-dependent transporter [Gammaproteobacteria bacterium]
MHTGDVQKNWSSRVVFLLAAIGAAVGLGNIWKFPYTAGVSGGGAFVLVYAAAVLAIAIPIVMAELLIGRRARRSPVAAFIKLAREAGGSTGWQITGWINLTAAFLILSFYSVIAGWAVAYVPKLASGVFTGADAALTTDQFQGLLASPWSLVLWHSVFMVLSVVIVARGVQKGIESAVKFLMPTLFALLLMMVVYAAIAGDMQQAVDFLFKVDFSKVDGSVVLNAVGQAFFSVSVSMGLLIAYGAYLPETVNIPRSAVIIAFADTFVAILAGLAIFPLVFGNHLDPAEGPGLIFVTLPIAFGNMPLGWLFGSLFFVLVVFAALTSAIALMEPVVSWAQDSRQLRRSTVATLIGLAVWLVGLASVLSFNVLADFKPLPFGPLEGKTLFDLLDFITSNVLLPVGGILIALFTGWVLSSDSTREELGMPEGFLFKAWQFLLRFVAPVALAKVLWDGMGF